MKLKLLNLTLLTCLVLMGCKELTEQTELAEEDFDAYMIESSLGNVEVAANERDDGEVDEDEGGGQVPPGFFKRLTHFFSPFQIGHSCVLRHMDPPIGSTSCEGSEEDKTITSEFRNCGKRRFRLSANLKLAFDSPETCAAFVEAGEAPSSGEVIKTVDEYLLKFPKGKKVSINSDTHSNYLDEEISGGVKTTFVEGGRVIEILGLHRKGMKSKRRDARRDKRRPKRRRGRRDQSIRTSTPLEVSGNGADGTKSIQSGAIKVDHNLAKFTSITSFSELNWDTSCCYPVSGTIEVEFSGSKTGNLLVDFNSGTCGEVSIQKDNGEQRQVNLRACE